VLQLAISAFAAFFASVAVVVSAEPCTLCSGGDAQEYDPDGTIGTLPCSQLASVLGSTDASASTCLETQVQAYRHCSCASYPVDSFCSMCPDGAYDVSMPSKIVSVALGGGSESALTCEEALFLPKRGNGAACAYLRQEASYLCGCPGFEVDDGATTKSCGFCADGGPVGYPDRLLPDTYERTCYEYETEASLTSVADASGCSAIGSDLPVDARAYCGCPDTVPVERCDMCPGVESFATNPNVEVTIKDGTGTTLSCQQVDTAAAYVTDTTYCGLLQEAAASTCCSSSEQPAPDGGGGGGEPPSGGGGNGDPSSGASDIAISGRTMAWRGFVVLLGLPCVLALVS